MPRAYWRHYHEIWYFVKFFQASLAFVDALAVDFEFLNSFLALDMSCNCVATDLQCFWKCGQMDQISKSWNSWFRMPTSIYRGFLIAEPKLYSSRRNAFDFLCVSIPLAI